MKKEQINAVVTSEELPKVETKTETIEEAVERAKKVEKEAKRAHKLAMKEKESPPEVKTKANPEIVRKKNIKMSISAIIKGKEAGTFNYMFEIELNRQLSTTHVNQLAKEITNLYDIIGDKCVAPIYVFARNVKGTELLYVLDGQHRVQACINIFEQSGIDINLSCIILDGDKLNNMDLVKIIATFNSSSLKWKNLTYIDLFSKMHVNGYTKLQELLTNKEHKYYATNLAQLYTGAPNGLAMIKKGEKLDVKGGDIRKKQFDEIVALMPEQRRQAKLFRTMTNILLKPNYNHEEFIVKFKKFVEHSYFPKTETDLYKKMVKLV